MVIPNVSNSLLGVPPDNHPRSFPRAVVALLPSSHNKGTAFGRDRNIDTWGALLIKSSVPASMAPIEIEIKKLYGVTPLY
jgi:hypothetical protein